MRLFQQTLALNEAMNKISYLENKVSKEEKNKNEIREKV